MRNILNKPKILSDVRPTGSISVFKKINDPLGRHLASLSWSSVPRWTKNIFIIFVTVVLFFVFSGARLFIMAPTALSQSSDEERKSLESELEKIQSDIDVYEQNISDLQGQKKTLSQSIKIFDAEINKLNLQIKATDIQLNKLDKEIADLQTNIHFTEGDIGKLKVFLIGSLRQLYSDDQETTVELILKDEKLSDFFGNINSLTVLQTEMRDNLDQLVELKTNLMNQKDVLATERQDVLSLKAIQTNQQTQLNSKKKEKNDLLALTKGQESKYQDLLKKSKQSAAQIRSRIFELLGGGELRFEDAYKLAKFASDQTGVRAALILAVLDRESSLGQNIGKCNYKTAMNPSRDQQIFLDLTTKLGIDPNSVSVSCANADGAYGGAMGPSQFIPSTWIKYSDRIAAITGNSIPSPWKNTDAFVATALYLKDVGADKQTYVAERKAAAIYYAGSRWSRYLYSYGQWVVERANQFAEDIQALLS